MLSFIQENIDFTDDKLEPAEEYQDLVKNCKYQGRDIVQNGE